MAWVVFFNFSGEVKHLFPTEAIFPCRWWYTIMPVMKVFITFWDGPFSNRALHMFPGMLCKKWISPKDPLGHVRCKKKIFSVKMVINGLRPFFPCQWRFVAFVYVCTAKTSVIVTDKRKKYTSVTHDKAVQVHVMGQLFKWRQGVFHIGNKSSLTFLWWCFFCERCHSEL